jgi:branched-chain amino acid transport system permease protein
MIRDILQNLLNINWKLRILILAVLVVFVAYSFIGIPYYLSLLMSIFMYVVLCASWNVISGFTGYVSFGHVAFWGMGAYITAITITKLHFPWPVALVASGVGTSLFAALISFPILKLSSVYFAISMLALAETVKILVSFFRSLTGGGGGIYLPPIVSVSTVYLLMGFLAFFMLLITYALQHTKFFKSLLAIRDNALASESLGIDTTRRKIQAFIFSAFFPAIAGGIYILNVAFIDPKTAFNISITLNTIMMTIFGGIATVLGPLIGPVVFLLLSEALWARFPFIHKAVLGVVIVIMVLGLPNGIMPFVFRFTGWVKEKLGANNP